MAGLSSRFSLRGVAGGCVYAYTAAVVGMWALMWLAGDRWWFATLMLFGPRWVVALPLLMLVPLALALRVRWLGALGLSAVVLLWPIMGLNLPWRTLADSPHADLRVMTYNVDRWSVSQARFENLLAMVQPDLIAVQEARPSHVPKHWHVERAGELVVISAYPIVDVAMSYNRDASWRGPYVNCLYCVVETPAGRIGFANVHLGTPRPGLSAVVNRRTLLDLDGIPYAHAEIEARWRESEAVARWLEGFPEPKIIAGDFNMPAESAIYRTFWRGYRNAFHRAGLGFGYTKQTPIRGRVYGTRIDHILTGAALYAVRCRLGPDKGSDHLPLVADLAWELEAGN